MSIALFLSMIASVFLSFSIPVFFWGRFGYKTKGFFSSVIIGAAAYLIYFLIKTHPFDLKRQALLD